MSPACGKTRNHSRSAGLFLEGNRPGRPKQSSPDTRFVFMLLMESSRQSIIDQNRREFADSYDDLNWVSPARAGLAEKERRELLAVLGSRGVKSCADSSKLYSGELSPGCRRCVAGDWSCLFINGICNAGCFYCPTPQQSKGEPTTNTLRFAKPRDYISYLEKFAIRGVSLSGGEPLMTLDRSLNFLTAIKKRFGSSVYLWMYTNGILLTSEIMARLRAAGLDEIRFDITADKYCLDKVGLAVNRIPNVTVEIPALPEDLPRLLETARELDRLGVSFLNLHQLRLTPHNRPRLQGRNYSYLHGPRATVLESELAALRVLEFAAGNCCRLSINYCSYIYKHQYQARGARRRAAALISKPFESITATGLIRSLTVRGSAADLQQLAATLVADPRAAGLWQQNGADTIYLHPELLARLDPARHGLSVSYHSAALKPAVSYQHAYREIELSPRRRLVVERAPCQSGLLVPAGRFAFFVAGIRDGAWPVSGDPGEDWGKICDCERFRPGLGEYY